jgi:hypothetical protein
MQKYNYKLCIRKLCHRNTTVQVPTWSAIMELVKRLHFLIKKYPTQNAMLTEENLDKTGTTLEHSPCKSLTRLAQ